MTRHLLTLGFWRLALISLPGGKQGTDIAEPHLQSLTSNLFSRRSPLLQQCQHLGHPNRTQQVIYYFAVLYQHKQRDARHME